MESKSAPPGTQAALRAVRLLKAFSPQQPERSLAELHTAAKLSKTTAHRLLAALESEGLIERNSATGGYRLGAAAVALGAIAQSSNELRRRVRPVLEALAAETGETVTLEVASGLEVLILDEVAGEHLISASANVGTRWPIHATSTGKILLALSPALRQQLEFPLASFTGRTVTGVRALDRELSVGRKQGFAVAIGELEDGYAAVAAPVRDPSGAVAGAISVGGPGIRLTASRLRALGAMLCNVVAR